MPSHEGGSPQIHPGGSEADSINHGHATNMFTKEEMADTTHMRDVEAGISNGNGQSLAADSHTKYINRCSEDKAADEAEVAPLRGLSILDRFLVVWILLAMAIGIILGNTVPSTGPALQKGKFVGVSIPIGKQIFIRHPEVGILTPA